MMPSWILFLIGVFLGAIIGFFAAVLCVAGGRADDDEKRLCLEIELVELRKQIGIND
jgi:hypothetical protein